MWLFSGTQKVILAAALAAGLVAGCGGGGDGDSTDASRPPSQPVAVAGALEATYRDGRGEDVRFHTPRGLAAAPDGSVLIADTGNQRLRKLDPSSGTVSTVGEALVSVIQVAVHNSSEVFVRSPVSRFLFSQVNRIPQDGGEASFYTTAGGAHSDSLAVDRNGNLYFSDSSEDGTRTLALVAPDKTKRVLISDLNVTALTVDNRGTVYFSGLNLGLRFGTVDPAGNVSIIATSSGNPDLEANSRHTIHNIAVDDERNIYFPDGKFIRRLAPSGAVSTVADLTSFAAPSFNDFIYGLTLQRGALYATLSNRLIKVPLATGT